MTGIIRWVFASSMLVGVCYAGDDLGQINAQMQAQLKQQQTELQQQIGNLNTQLQAQIKQMHDDLQNQIDSLNTQTQKQMDQLQSSVQQNMLLLQQQIKNTNQNKS
ncbi:MAG: hypothetical protein ACRC0B_07010 [Legionella sp.]